MSVQTCADVLGQLDRSVLAKSDPIWIGVGHIRVKLICAAPLYEELKQYYRYALVAPGEADATVEVLDGQALRDPPDWIDWAREPGKTGRKDAIFDLDDGRLVYKQRTGVTFLQSTDAVVAFGPCGAHSNQVVNFLNTQILNIGLCAGWQICHAAAVTNGARSLAVAGLSGGGKSTSMLRFMDMPGVSFVSNDRLLVQAEQPFPKALGIPKEPRINPGTILHNSRLHRMLTTERLAELAEMPSGDLWELEEKYDLIVADIYGPDRVQYDAPLTDFWVLNWSRDAAADTQLVEVDLAERPDLLSAIMKSAGPFYQKPNQEFLRDFEPCIASDYLQALAGVRVKEVTGKVDFDAMAAFGQTLFSAKGAQN
ncbi:HprK-related kinase B [Epibacterium ulvae]|uniref:HprK-related kinase B n=1 Tax=Epibacterium ulvae TaxID=1156985 RepID=UPI001BFCCB99|nr:HprK-related kinase B [Epibacterium ulvae]MBT8153456.1 HprK-related kinase B [Epibacterium ulvae]